MTRKTKKLKSVVKSISFREDVMSYAEEMAGKLHGGNLSAFLTTLVSAHKEGIELLMVNRGETVHVSSQAPINNESEDDEDVEDDNWRDKISLDDEDMDWIKLTTTTGVRTNFEDDEDDDGDI